MSDLEWIRFLDEQDFNTDEIQFFAEIEYFADLEQRHAYYLKLISEYNS